MDREMIWSANRRIIRMRVLYYHEVAEAMKISRSTAKTAVITKKLRLLGR